MSDGSERPEERRPPSPEPSKARPARSPSDEANVAPKRRSAARRSARSSEKTGDPRRRERTIPPPPIDVGEMPDHRVGFWASIRSGLRRDPAGISRDVSLSLGGIAGWIVFTIIVFQFAIFALNSVAGRGSPSLELGWLTEDETRAREERANRPVKVELSRGGAGSPSDPGDEPMESGEGDTSGDGGPSVVAPVDTRGLFRNRERNFDLLIANGGDDKTKTAISQGLAWLKRQQHEDGHWRYDDPTKYPDGSDWPTWKTHSGATAIALLAFLGAGNTHLDGQYADTVKKGLDWLIAQQRKKTGEDEGDFFEFYEQGREAHFFAHSLATIAICEAYAITRDDTLREPAEKAVAFLVDAQHPVKGGWGYQPLRDETSEAHMWVTGWGLMALFTARSAGIEVDAEDFRRSSRFIDSVMVDGGLGFRNRSHPDDPVRESLLAKGVLARQYLGWPRDEPVMLEAVEGLLSAEARPRWEPRVRNLYGWYHAAQVLHNLGGDDWKRWYADVEQILVDNQRSLGRQTKGSWDPFEPSGAPHELADKMGRLYSTAMCLLILETPFRHMPVYETSERGE